MSSMSLGDQAKVGKIIADDVYFKNSNQKYEVLTNADVAPPRTTGFYACDATAGAMSLAIPDGNDGDIIDFLRINSNANGVGLTGNFANSMISVSLRGFTSHAKLMWIEGFWYLIGRTGTDAMTPTAVAVYPQVS